jgi:purine-binding chemotaxis protein CheW
MFASEQVMKQYLDQLLADESDDQYIVEKSSNDAIIDAHVPASKPQAESKYSAKIKQRFNEAELKARDRDEKLQLKPIESVIRADKNRPVKEREQPKDNVHSLEQLLNAVSMQQQEAAEALAERERLASEAKLKTEQKAAAEAKLQAELRQAAQVKAREFKPAEPEIKVAVQSDEVKPITVEKQRPTEAPEPKIERIDEPFQALFFEVAGLSLAVPLHELGGIYNLGEVTTLFGKPEWFKGVMVNRDKKINVVETARWVMPEKYDEKLKARLNYKYLIMLGESNWGFAAEKLVSTQYVAPDEVKWRKKSGKRPWLFGTIKEKMCALLHVEDLIKMLDNGLDARQN